MEGVLITHVLDALVLAGGEGKRMGSPKALLPFGNTTLIGAVLRVLRPIFRKVLVVCRDPAGLPRLGVDVLMDDRPQRGPLVGLARGLAASDASWCFAVGCDMPFLRLAVIQRMAGRLEGCDILVPHVMGRLQPLHAFYSRSCLAPARVLLDEGETSLQALLDRCRVRTMTAGDFLDVDTRLMSFLDVDTAEDYERAQGLLDKAPDGEVAS
ncbi:MAG: molybdenum cofactor guanylyltransferase [Chloroflexi bacterium]|nr:molybdenum cofactor guanylyltransferase [Chloroflexota bacterium]